MCLRFRNCVEGFLIAGLNEANREEESDQKASVPELRPEVGPFSAPVLLQRAMLGISLLVAPTRRSLILWVYLEDHCSFSRLLSQSMHPLPPLYRVL